MKGSVQSGAAARIRSIHRYPVKSLVGEELARAHVGERGLHGDRWWSVRDPDGKLGSGKSTRRFRKMEGLLELAAYYDGETPLVSFPDGRSLRGDDEEIHRALSAYVGRPVRLAHEETVSHFDEGPLHLVTTSAIRFVERAHGRAVDPRRLRPNLVLETAVHDGMVEEAWVGRRVAVGADLVIEVRAPMPRCVMLTMPQRGLGRDAGLLDAVTRLNDMNLGVVADVLVPGVATVGDTVRILG